MPINEQNTPSLSYSFTTDGVYTVAWLYRDIYGNALPSPQHVVFPGLTAQAVSGLGYTDSQILPTYRVSVVGGQITSARSIKAKGGINTSNLVTNAVTPAKSSFFDDSDTFIYSYLPASIQSAITSGGLVIPNFTTAIPTSAIVLPLQDLSNVQFTALTNHDVLSYNSSLSKWVNSAPVSGGSGGSGTLAGDTDVSITSPHDGDYLQFNASAGASGLWENTQFNEALGNLSDMNVFGYAIEGSTIQYNASTNKWDAVNLSLEDLTDTKALSGIMDGQTLVWSSSASAYLPGSSSGGGGGATIVSTLPTPSSTNRGQFYLLTPSGSGSSLSQLQVSDGAAHLWILNETSGGVALDSIAGSAYNGTYQNVTLGQTALAQGSDYSAYFNGSNSYMATTLTDPNGSSSANPWTMEFVFISSSTNGNLRVLANAHSDTNGNGVMIRLSQTELQVNMGSNDQSLSVSLGGTVHHFCLTYSGSGNGFAAYIDGTQVLSSTQAYSTGSSLLSLGYDSTYSGDYWVGTLGNFAIYHSVLTSTQITTHYNAMTEQIQDNLYICKKVGSVYQWSPIA